MSPGGESVPGRPRPWQQKLQDTLALATKNWEKVCERRNLASTDPSVPFTESHLEWLSFIEHEIAVLNLRLSSSPIRGLGQVFLASGLEQTSGSDYLLDWGLISLDPKRFPKVTDLTSASCISIRLP